MGFLYFINLYNFFFKKNIKYFLNLSSFIKLFIFFKDKFKNFSYFNMYLTVLYKNIFINNFNFSKFLFFIFHFSHFFKKNLVLFDLFKVSDTGLFLSKFSYSFQKKLTTNKFSKQILNKFFILYKFYSLFFKNIVFFYKNISVVKFNKQLSSNFYIRYINSFFIKFISLNKKNLNDFSILYIRKNRIFNKSRYSRNRQLYRTGVYWCLWLNIIIVYMLFFYFYRFTFNFGYLWYGVYFLLFSFIWSKVLKYNLFNVFILFDEIFNFIKWLVFIFFDVFSSLKIYFFEFNKFFWISYVYNNIFIFKNFSIFIFIKHFYFYIKRNFLKFFKYSFNWWWWYEPSQSHFSKETYLFKNIFSRTLQDSKVDDSVFYSKTFFFLVIELIFFFLNFFIRPIFLKLRFPRLILFFKDIFNFFKKLV